MRSEERTSNTEVTIMPIISGQTVSGCIANLKVIQTLVAREMDIALVFSSYMKESAAVTIAVQVRQPLTPSKSADKELP